MLTIRIFSGASISYPLSAYLWPSDPKICAGRGLSLAPGVQIPEAIQKALDSVPLARRSTSNRESLQRRRNWWLPYVVLEFDKNEILIDAMGGDLSSPVWNYRADLCVAISLPTTGFMTDNLDSDVSRTSNISVSSYLRTTVAGHDDMGNDLLMARVDLTPMLEGHVSFIQFLYHFVLRSRFQ